jgi:hypothetical protein
MLTLQKIKGKLEELEQDEEGIFADYGSYMKSLGFGDYDVKELKKLTGWDIKQIYQERLHNDPSTELVIFKFSDHESELLVGWDGYYNSYDSTDYRNSKLKEYVETEIVVKTFKVK